jgi:hypothetical protein
LGKLRGLKTLRLDHNPIAGPGLAHLAACTQLQSLSLRHTQVTGDAVLRLRNHPSLASLDLYGSKVTDGERRILKEAMPQVRGL